MPIDLLKTYSEMSTEQQTFIEILAGMPVGDRQALEVRISTACNVSFATIGKWRYGVRTPKAASQEIISSILGIPVRTLFPPKTT